MTNLGWKDDELGPDPRATLVACLLDTIEFMCGSSLPDGNSWGCKKLFRGVSSLAQHFKSDTGMICWAPLEFQELSPSDRFALKGLGKEMDDLRIKTCSTSSGLPLALATAGAYLDQVLTSFSDYLRLYRESWLKLQRTGPEVSSYGDRALYSI
jgi:hypothetical protein